MIAMTTRLLAAALLLLVPQIAVAQSPPAAGSPPPTEDQLLKPSELDALVAPIALYPDTLLAEIFMASTYPLEIVEADRWVKANANLKGDALKAAVDKQSWDESIKSLVATPSVLDMMSTQLTWTQALGNAVLAQQPDVMAAVQRLRQKAQANNKLTSNQQQTVSTEQQDGQSAIIIAPTEPDTIYVPYYDPSVVYGPWPYPDYPPYYWPAPAYIGAGILATGIAFGAGYALARWGWQGYRWGGGLNWGNRNILVNRSANINVNNWTHNPVHRQGVRYTNAGVAQRYGNRNIGAAQTRMDFRGRGGGGAPQISAGARPNISAGARPNISAGGNRPNVNRPAGRPGGNALGGISSGRVANIEATRGRQSLGGGGGFHGGGGGGGFHGGGGGGFRGGGGGRRSDIRLKHDIVLLGRLDNGLGFYRFAYNGDNKAYVGVMAQEVQAIMPQAVTRGRDGYLRVFYDRLGLKFETFDQWVASGAQLPAAVRIIQ